ncbi:Peptide methionine sulfoxide reductase [Gracilaria domingensis]|nr:Peptide methionine sulfoxide reductase [Gracilaria domingensis]
MGIMAKVNSGGAHNISPSEKPRVDLIHARVEPVHEPAIWGRVLDSDWRSVLTAQEYNTLKKSTEYPGAGEYDAFCPTNEHFACRAFRNALRSAQAQLKSGYGRPTFDGCYKDSIKIEEGVSFGTVREEIMCNRCDGHVGHVFGGERLTKTNERHCVNNASVKYVEGSVDKGGTSTTVYLHTEDGSGKRRGALC